MSLRYDWPPKRGTSVGLAIGIHSTPASRESELLRLKVDNRFADELRGATRPNFGVERCSDAIVLRSKIEVSKHESKSVRKVQGLGLNQASE